MNDAWKRFFDKVQKNDSCWLWIGAISSNGYGSFQQDGKRDSAHAWSYRHFKGPVPAGLQIDHLCRVRNCVNPEHLEAVTPRTNNMRGETVTAANAAKTHCKHGHPFNEANTYYRKDRPGGRECRVCMNARRRAKAVK